MRSLRIDEVQLISGGNLDGTYVSLSTLAGVYLGSRIAYYEPLMNWTMTTGPLGTSTFTPNYIILVGGASIGAVIGLGIGAYLFSSHD